jgi:hypothetical protein
MKKFINIIACLVLSFSYVEQEDFSYQYRIKGNSFALLDEAALYYYKEKMIDKYEKYLLGATLDTLGYYLSSYLDFFKLSDDASVTYSQGIIFVVLGQGKGLTISGKFKKNECDDSIIREKYYLLELFS